MSKYLYIFDAGHGGLDPKTGKYVTAGKRMEKDGFAFYEGVNNRDNVKRIIEAMEKAGLEAIDIVNDWRDVSLSERVRRANELARGRKCVYISIHSDANSNGKEWNQASGIGTYVYDRGSLSSNLLAKYMNQELACNFEGMAKDRKVKKCAFYVVRTTNCPAVLLELGFHTNENEVKLMQGDDWKNRVVKSVVDACNIFELKN
jgi:N-acetylmuramoyl-L-alanine amidase